MPKYSLPATPSTQSDKQKRLRNTFVTTTLLRQNIAYILPHRSLPIMRSTLAGLLHTHGIALLNYHLDHLNLRSYIRFSNPNCFHHQHYIRTTKLRIYIKYQVAKQSKKTRKPPKEGFPVAIKYHYTPIELSSMPEL